MLQRYPSNGIGRERGYIQQYARFADSRMVLLVSHVATKVPWWTRATKPEHVVTKRTAIGISDNLAHLFDGYAMHSFIKQPCRSNVENSVLAIRLNKIPLAFLLSVKRENALPSCNAHTYFFPVNGFFHVRVVVTHDILLMFQPLYRLRQCPVCRR